jgi:hypothetical protein
VQKRGGIAVVDFRTEMIFTMTLDFIIYYYYYLNKQKQVGMLASMCFETF